MADLLVQAANHVHERSRWSSHAQLGPLSHFLPSYDLDFFRHFLFHPVDMVGEGLELGLKIERPAFALIF